MMHYTNKGNVSLTMAVWLAANDGYDRKFDPNTFSATEILNPIRMIVLSRQLAAQQAQGSVDIEDLVPSRVGHAVHKAAEVSWVYNRTQAFKNLQIPQNVIDRIRVNPDRRDTRQPKPEGCIDVYIEQRAERKICGVTISGMFDFCIDGVVEDIKTTKTYNWIHGGNDEKYMQQESIYKWMNQDIITKDYCNIHFMFTDFKAHLTVDKDYPQRPIMTRKIQLMDPKQTEQFIRDKLGPILEFVGTDQSELPLCTDEELWMAPSRWRWYKGGKVTARATKVFDTYSEAAAHAGGVGLIVEFKQKAKRCYYCDARPICTQAAQLSADKLLD